MLGKFNSFIEKWMAFVTPACLLMGVLFPDIAKHGVPYVTYAFAFMTFIGALKSRFRDVADVFKKPLPLILMLLVLHVLVPVIACGLGHLLFPQNMNYVTGMVLEFSVPTAVISLMWVSIYNGNSPLSLTGCHRYNSGSVSDSGGSENSGWFQREDGYHGNDERTGFYDCTSGSSGDVS